MDAFDLDNVKAVKANAIRRYNLLTTFAKFFRTLELCLALILLSWILTRLPFAVKISEDYARHLSAILTSPLFVFLIINAIIATLLAKSGQINSGSVNAGDQLYKEMVNNVGVEKSRSEPHETEEDVHVEYQDKRIVSEGNMITHTPTGRSEMDVSTEDLEFPKVYRRTQSEKLKRQRESTERELRRSETGKYGKSVDSEENTPPENLYPEDKLSNEEFQRTIEAFIAKRTEFLREESLAIVVKNQNNKTLG